MGKELSRMLADRKLSQENKIEDYIFLIGDHK